ncbi:MAG: AbiH family protein [Flavobacteriaceae bacterium]
MSKILITGNGFDLFHGLPTKYGHFMAVMETIENNTFNFENEIEFDELFGKAFKENYTEDYEKIKSNFDVKKIKFDNKKIKEIKSFFPHSKTNISNVIHPIYWYHHFKTVNKIYTWIDFENEIKNVLDSFVNFFNLFQNTYIVNNDYSFRNTENFINYKKIESFNILLFQNRNRNFKVVRDYIGERDYKLKQDKILLELETSLESFLTYFNIYLSEIIFPFYDVSLDLMKIPFYEVDFFKTFNYLPTIQKLYNKNYNVSHLHGEIIHNNETQNIVIGIDKIPEEIAALKAFNFLKSYQKVSKEIKEFFIEIPNEKSNIIEQNIFYVFGHSLDSSDKNYFIDLFAFLKNDYSETSRIIIFYLNKLDKENKIKNLFSYIDENEIIKYNESDRLCFVEINESNLDNYFKINLWKKDYIF